MHELENKLIVVDTSSLLMNGTKLLKVLKNCTLVLPNVVINELENNRTDSSVGSFARQWLRLLEKLRVEYGSTLKLGVELHDEDNVMLKIEANHTNQETLPKHLVNGSNDSTILAIANNLKNDPAVSDDIVLMSNDVPMRLHATISLGLPAFEYTAAAVSNSEPWSGKQKVILSDEEYYVLKSELKSEDDIIDIQEYDFLINQLNAEISNSIVAVALEEDPTVIVDYFDLADDELGTIDRKVHASKIIGRSLEQDVALSYLKESFETLPIVSLGGSAGTGKTLMAIAAGLEAVKNGEYSKILVLKSLHEMGQGQEIGFLPGDLTEKISAWSGSILDAVDVIALSQQSGKKDPEKLKNLKKQLFDYIEIAPITYLRGRSLTNSYIVVEEAQNFSRNELINVITRCGLGSKLVLTFDANQCDNKFLKSGKDNDVWTVVRDFSKSDLFAHITLTKTERSKLAEFAANLL